MPSIVSEEPPSWRHAPSIGVGGVTTDLPLTGEELDLRTRAAMMDEGIDLIRSLRAAALSYQGTRPARARSPFRGRFRAGLQALAATPFPMRGRRRAAGQAR